jgi:hypothetical protein
MNITLRTRHLEISATLHDQLHARVAASLARLATAIRTVDVTLVDVNGPRGGLDKHCRIRVRGPGLRTIVVEHLGADALGAVWVAAERTEQAVIRSLGRRRSSGSVLDLLLSLRRHAVR